MAYVTIKVREETRAALRIIAAVTDEQMVQVLERLCRLELERVVSEATADGKMALVTMHMRKGKSFVNEWTSATPNDSGGTPDDDSIT